MTSPLDVARALFGAVTLASPALPEPVQTAVKVINAGLDLAASLTAAGHDPVAAIAEMARTVERFDARTAAGRTALDAALDALGIAPTVPPPAVALRAPTDPFGHATAPDAPATPPEPAEGGA